MCSMLVDVVIASVLGGVVLYMLLNKWCLIDNSQGMLVVLGGDAKNILKPAPASTITTVSKNPLEAAEEKAHQATDGHTVPTG